MTNLVETLSAAAATSPGASLFVGNPNMSEEQQLQRFAEIVGEAQPEPEAAPVAPKQEQPVPPVVAEQVVTPEAPAPVEATEPARMAVPAVDLDALTRELAESGVDEETAKKLAAGPIGRLAQASANAVHEAEKARVDRIASKYGTVYPELKKPGVMEMLSQGGASDQEILKRMHVIYGDRKGELRQQVANQMTAPNRKVDNAKPKSEDDVAFAAFAEYFNSGGNLQKALALKQELKGQ